MGCSVNHAQLSQLQRVMNVIVAKGWLGELAQRISAAGMKLVADEFKTETDPYGNKWAPLARERGRNKRARLRAMAAGKKVKGQKILQDTGRMKNSVGAVPRGNTARLVIPTWYAAVHQSGGKFTRHPTLRQQATRSMAGRAPMLASTTVIPRRMMLPEGELPDRWKRVFVKESNLLLAQKLEVRR
jgi:phage gpG-like protein